MNPVYITRTAAFLPNPPVGNADVETVLGRVGERPSRSRAIVLRSNGIKSRHYVINTPGGIPSHTNAGLAAAAVGALGVPPAAIELLCCGTSLSDQLMPGHASMVHGEIGGGPMAVVSTAGICLAGMTALHHAYLAIMAGQAQQAVACASEIASLFLAGRRYVRPSQEAGNLGAHPELAFGEDFLRWMLSDGAGAFALAAKPVPGAVNLRIDWMEIQSYANRLPACMIAGANFTESRRVRGWLDYLPEQLIPEGVLSLKQDVRLLNEQAAPVMLGDFLLHLKARRGLDLAALDWFLPHISSMYFWPVMRAEMQRRGLMIDEARWFTNLQTRGNTGAASIYIMLDELVSSGRLRPGQKLLLWVPESGRFSASAAHLTVA